MLTYPNRGRFQELRAHWESPQAAGNNPTMVSQKDKQAPCEPTGQEAITTTGPSKFRRKLSQGLSLVTRRTTPRRQPSVPQEVVPTSTVANPNNALPLGANTSLSSACHSSVHGALIGLPPQSLSAQSSLTAISTDSVDVTPKPLPRSQTMSFIPRPTRSDSELSLDDHHTPPKQQSPPVFRLEPCVPPHRTKIPSPPTSEGRRSSARQYMESRYTPRQAKHIAAGVAFAEVGDNSPSKDSVRSQTTPNLVDKFSAPGPSFMMPRKSLGQIQTQGMHQSSLKENTPKMAHDHRRLSQLQGQDMQASNRHSLAIQTKLASKRSLLPSAPVSQSKQPLSTSPSVASKRQSSNRSVNASTTTGRSLPQGYNFAKTSTSYRTSHNATIVQPRLMGPVNPPSPCSSSIESPKLQSALPRARTERDLRWSSVQPPLSLREGNSSTRPINGGNQEVRFMRSNTFHLLPIRHEIPPPLPPIPDRYMNPGKPALTAQRRAATSTVQSIKLPNPHPAMANIEMDVQDGASSICRTDLQSTQMTNTAVASTHLSVGKSVDLLESHGSNSTTMQPIPSRPWSTNKILGEGANIDDLLQVTDYQDPVWWAGRFQARMDQWRTAAMEVESESKCEPEGSLSRCALSDDKIAACNILAQLRDLCASSTAADSLWAFEHKYRQDHRMLDAMTTPALWPGNEQSPTPKQGTFGRAVRKLTPRKASFVNLLKGKGWNKVVEEAKPSFDENTVPTIDTSYL